MRNNKIRYGEIQLTQPNNLLFVERKTIHKGSKTRTRRKLWRTKCRKLSMIDVRNPLVVREWRTECRCKLTTVFFSCIWNKFLNIFLDIPYVTHRQPATLHTTLIDNQRYSVRHSSTTSNIPYVTYRQSATFRMSLIDNEHHEPHKQWR
jgi:hypothetical protein